MISENDSRQAYDLNNAGAVPQQSSQQSQKAAQNSQAASSQASSSQTNPATSISSQYFNLQNFANQQMDINQYLENQMSQLTQIICILKQMQVNQIEPLKSSTSQHQSIIDQLQSHQSQFQQFIKQQSQLNQQHSLKLQQQEQQLSQLQNLVHQLQNQANMQQQNMSTTPAQPQYVSQSQAQPQVTQIQQQATQGVQNPPQQNQQQPPSASISAPPVQTVPSSHQNIQPAQNQPHYAHVDPHLGLSMSQNPLQYLNQAQLMSLLANHVQLNTKHIPVHQGNQLVNNLVYSGPVHDDGDNLHMNYTNFSHLNSQSIEALGQLIQQRLSLGSGQNQSRPIPSNSPNQQDAIINGNLSEQTLQQQIENVLTGTQPVQSRPISLASNVLVQASTGQSNTSSSAQTASSQAQMMTHTSNTPRILNLTPQIVSDQVLMSNTNSANMATGASMQNQNQQQNTISNNNQNQ